MILFEQDERTKQEIFADRVETVYTCYLSMMGYWGEYVTNTLDMPTANRILTIGSELKDLVHDLKNVK